MKHVVNSLLRRLDPQMGATIDRKDILSIGHPTFVSILESVPCFQAVEELG